MDTPLIFTYHCICSHLVLATTRDIFKLPRRQPPGIDGALIVPLPPPPRSADSDNESDDNDEEDEEGGGGGGGGGDDDNDGVNDREQDERMDIDRRGQESGPPEPVSEGRPGSSDNGDRHLLREEPEPKDYTLLLSSIRDRRPCVIRREDGFEKRLLWRCGRCRLIFGYQIYDESLEELSRSEGNESHRGKKGQPNKNYYVYILPGGLTTAAGMGSLTELDLQLVKED
ncbi:hypothetical protein TWF730_001278 [Orbilia blumenaviensis]|uniref:STEEP1 domain-containing protein n=1 Tax=Orbilia blumenaviensis TaxID=1796055 RepID=A0AAV9UKY4_9PEZI